MAEFQMVIKERKRMCSCFTTCVHCPLGKAHGGSVPSCRDWTFNNPEEAERIIMQWSVATMFEVNRGNADWLDEEYQETE